MSVPERHRLRVAVLLILFVGVVGLALAAGHQVPDQKQSESTTTSTSTSSSRNMPEGSWVERQLTFSNAMVLLVLLFNVGQFVSGTKAKIGDLRAATARLDETLETVCEKFVNKDICKIVEKNISERLDRIERELEEFRQP